MLSIVANLFMTCVTFWLFYLGCATKAILSPNTNWPITGLNKNTNILSYVRFIVIILFLEPILQTFLVQFWNWGIHCSVQLSNLFSHSQLPTTHVHWLLLFNLGVIEPTSVEIMERKMKGFSFNEKHEFKNEEKFKDFSAVSQISTFFFVY